MARFKEVKLVDAECRCLLGSLEDSAGPAWDGSVIIRLKEILEDNYYKAVSQGLHYTAVLSVSTVIRTLDVLVGADLFDEHDQSDDFALELHLRCVVAALRVLTLYGAFNCRGYLTFDLLDKIYSTLAKWATCHSLQSGSGFRSFPPRSFENCNNEFQLVFARDWIASVSSDRDLASHAVAHLAAAVSSARQLVTFTPQDAHAPVPIPRSLQATMQKRPPPSSWHQEYLEIERFLYSIRQFHDSNARTETKGLVQGTVTDLQKFSNDSEDQFFDIFQRLVQKDVEKSNLVPTDEFEPGTLPSLAEDAYRDNDDIIQMPPMTRKGHFTFALLDLIQYQLIPYYSDSRSALTDIILHVIKSSHHSFIQRKALEVLLSISKKDPANIEIRLGTMLSETSLSNAKTINGLWRNIKKRADEFAHFMSQLPPITAEYQPSAQSAGAVQLSVVRLESLVESLESLLVCPVPPAKGEEFFQLIPCGHCQSRLAWMTTTTTLCSVCSTKILGTGPPLPAGALGDVLHELIFECKNLENWIQDMRLEAPPRSPRHERPPLTRTTSESASPTVKHRFTDIPARLFSKKPDPIMSRSSSIATDERSLLRESFSVDSFSEPVRGVGTRNRMKVLTTTHSSYAFQTTAISANCYKIALVSLADFIIHDVSAFPETAILCWGDITKRFAPSPKHAIEQKSLFSYYMAALTEEMLAIAMVERYVDIRNARTGERITQLTIDPPNVKCRSIIFSPNGQYLAVGLANGDVIVFQSGVRLDFGGVPVKVSYSGMSANTSRLKVTSIAFSPDSALIAISTKDNTVRAFHLDNLSEGHFQQYTEPVVYGKKSKPADISDISFLSDSHSLFIASKSRAAYPVVITKITSPRESQRAQVLTNTKREDEDYKVACYPKSNMLAAALITYAGEFLMMYMNPSGTNIWAVSHHSERLDLSNDKDKGFPSIGFSESRAIALDKRGNLLAMDLVFA